MADKQLEKTMTSDHDLLIRIDEKLTAFVTESRQVTQNITNQVSDHEARLRIQESTIENQKGSIAALRTVFAVVAFLVGAIEPVALWYLSK